MPERVVAFLEVVSINEKRRRSVPLRPAYFRSLAKASLDVELVTKRARDAVEAGFNADMFGTFIRNADRGSITGIPGIAVPASRTASGLPVGLALDGPVEGDKRLLSVRMAAKKLLSGLPAPNVRTAVSGPSAGRGDASLQPFSKPGPPLMSVEDISPCGQPIGFIFDSSPACLPLWIQPAVERAFFLAARLVGETGGAGGHEGF
jgi:hypothetical protein